MGFVCWVRGAILYSHSRFMMIPSLIFIKLLLITSIIHPLTLPLSHFTPSPNVIRSLSEYAGTARAKTREVRHKLQ